VFETRKTSINLKKKKTEGCQIIWIRWKASEFKKIFWVLSDFPNSSDFEYFFRIFLNYGMVVERDFGEFKYRFQYNFCQQSIYMYCSTAIFTWLKTFKIPTAKVEKADPGSYGLLLASIGSCWLLMITNSLTWMAYVSIKD
jgi:hypothetical protein